VDWTASAAFGFFAVLPPVAVLVWATRLWRRAVMPRWLVAMAGLLVSGAIVAIVAAIVVGIYGVMAMQRGDLDLVDKAKILATGISDVTTWAVVANLLSVFAALELAILSWTYRQRR